MTHFVLWTPVIRIKRWRPFDPQRNWPDLGERFLQGEKIARRKLYEARLQAGYDALHSKPDSNSPISSSNSYSSSLLSDVPEEAYMTEDHIEDDKRDLDWATVLKRTFESYIRGERPNMYGEWIVWTWRDRDIVFLACPFKHHLLPPPSFFGSFVFISQSPDYVSVSR